MGLEAKKFRLGLGTNRIDDESILDYKANSFD